MTVTNEISGELSGERSGGCQCGAVRYRLQGPLPAAYACHCGECKKQTASAFSLSVPIDTAQLRWTGDPAMFETTAFSGARKLCYFCAACGTRLWHRGSEDSASATLKVGTLDDPSGIEPMGHLWVSKIHPGISIAANVPAFETQPADVAAWRTGLSKR